MKLKPFLIFWLCAFPVLSAGEDASSSEETDLNPEREELQVRKTFPKYRVDFNHKSVQETVYKEFLKELKEKEKGE